MMFILFLIDFNKNRIVIMQVQMAFKRLSYFAVTRCCYDFLSGKQLKK